MDISISVVPDPADPAGIDGVITSIRSAADAGFARAWLPQLPPQAGMASWDTVTVLGLAGAQVPGIELGVSVAVAATQHPLVLARQARTAAAVTGGRVLLGVGVSHEFIVSEIFGYPYQAPAAYLREYLEVLRPALTGEAVDHHGERITAVGHLDLPGAPDVPVYAAALGPRMLRLAGELTAGTLTAWAGIRTIGDRIVPGIGKAAADAGRPAPEVIVGLPVSVTDDVEAARAEVTAAFDPSGLPAYRSVLEYEGVGSVADICVFGDEDQVAAQLRRFADAGATEFSAMPVGDATARARTVDVLARLRSV